MQALADLPHLKSLLLIECKDITGLLESAPELPQIESLVIQQCVNLDCNDLKHLRRIPNVKYIDLVCKTGTMNDTAIEHLSHLEHLETLALRIPWKDVTDVGLSKLASMKSLKKVIVLRWQSTPEQINRLQKAVPHCTLLY